MKNLLEVMKDLYVSEISSGVSTFWDGGFLVILFGDDTNSKRWERSYDLKDLDKAAEDLSNQARIFYPQSDYTKSFL